MRVRAWEFVIDMAVLGMRVLDRVYLFAYGKAYPPRATDEAQVVRAVRMDNE